MKIIITLTMLLFSMIFCFAETINDYRIKTEFIYNFISLTDIAGNIYGTESLCYLGTNDMMRQNLSSLNGKTANSKKIIFYSFAVNNANIGEVCDVLVADDTDTFTDTIPLKGMFVIGLDRNALADGAALRLYNEGARVRFDVSLSNANAAGIHISGKVLQHASEIYR